jgi:hypothetical protein
MRRLSLNSSYLLQNRHSKEAFISYFLKGRIAYPALTSFLDGNTNFGVDDLKRKVGKVEIPKRCAYGCVYFGKWDKAADRCGRFSEMYGPDIFTESSAQKLRDGTFDLNHYLIHTYAFSLRACRRKVS